MIAVLVNFFAVLIGAGAGSFFSSAYLKRFEPIIFPACGVLSLLVGMQMGFKSTHFLIIALSLSLGGIVGHMLGIEKGIEKLGLSIKNRFFKNDSSNFGQAFLDSTVLFCVGPMAIIGSFNAGVANDNTLIFTKSVMDGLMACLLASALGKGVLISAFSILLYQGLLTLLSVYISPFVSALVLESISGTGGAMVVMIGLNLTGAKKIPTADFLPALLLCVLLSYLVPYISFL